MRDCATSELDMHRRFIRVAVGVALVAMALLTGCGRIGFSLERFGDPTVDGGSDVTLDGSLGIDSSIGSDAGPPSDGGDGGTGSGDSGTVDGGDPPTGSCTDGMQNNDETGVDCGGLSCSACGSGCPPDLAGAYFCDSFESIPGAWSYNGGALAESTVVRSGAGSARFELTGTNRRDLGRTLLPNPPTSGSVYFRAYVFIAAGGTFNTIEIASLGSTNDPGTGRFDRLGIEINDGWYSASNGMTNTLYLGSGATIPRDQWLCVELDVDIDPGNGSLALRAEGREEVTAPGINSAPFEGYDFLNVGGVFLQGLTGTVTVYFDDVVLSRQPIGC